MARQQTERFLTEEIDPILAAEEGSLITDVAELRV
jgi:hypothetical protein